MAKHWLLVLNVLAVIFPLIFCYTPYDVTKITFELLCDAVSSVKDTQDQMDCFYEKPKAKRILKECSELTNDHDLGTAKGIFKGLCKKDFAEGKTEKDVYKCYVKKVSKYAGKGEKLKRALRRFLCYTSECVEKLQLIDVKIPV